MPSSKVKKWKWLLTNIRSRTLVHAHIFKVMKVRRCFGGSLRCLRLRSCTHPASLILSTTTLGPSSEHNTSRPESLPTNKIISNILLMSQNYIKSLKVDEYAWQTIYFRGSIGREPRHLAPFWHTPKQENAPRHKMNYQDTIGLKLYNTARYHIHSMELPANPWMCFVSYISTEWSVTKRLHLWFVSCNNNIHNCPSVFL